MSKDHKALQKLVTVLLKALRTKFDTVKGENISRNQFENKHLFSQQKVSKLQMSNSTQSLHLC